MKKLDRFGEEQQHWFDKHIGEELLKFDAAFERQMPDARQLEAFAAGYRRELRKKLWRDLTFFWLVAVALLLGMLWMLDRNWIWFVTLQTFAGAGAIGYIGYSYVMKVGHIWKRS